VPHRRHSCGPPWYVTEIALFLCMMFIPHKIHIYVPPRPVTELALLSLFHICAYLIQASPRQPCIPFPLLSATCLASLLVIRLPIKPFKILLRIGIEPLQCQICGGDQKPGTSPVPASMLVTWIQGLSEVKSAAYSGRNPAKITA
jgi:hypothetical protein